MKKIYQEISYFLKDEKSLKLRRKIIAWFSLFIYLIVIGLILIYIPSLLGILIEMDAAEKFAFSEGVEVLEKTFSHHLKVFILFSIPLVPLLIIINEYWDKNCNNFFAFLTGKDTPKNEDH